MIPIFTSHYTFGRSILTCSEASEINEALPTSIFSIAKLHDLKQVFVADNTFSGFLECVKSAEKLNVQLCWGLILYLCTDSKRKDEESLKTESKVIIWLKSSKGYKDLIQIYSKAATDNFYYQPRLDWDELRLMMTDNLLLTIPFYDSFLFKNILEGYNCIPHFQDLKPIFFLENKNLPFDYIIDSAVKNYALINKYETQSAHTIYYYKKVDAMAYQIFRCIDHRSTFDKPNLNHFSSDEFCFESYLENQNVRKDI